MMNDNSMLGDPSAAVQASQQQAAQMQQQPPMPMEPQEGTPEDDQEDSYVDYALSQANLAKGLKKKKDKDGNDLLTVMGEAIYDGYIADERSRDDWMKKNKKWMELALQVTEEKTFPWPRAANIKYPLVATAAMQFSARAYPALVPADGSVVKARVAKRDTTGQLTEAASRVARHMSWQVMERIPKWEENMDKLLMVMAISGIAFKKTYHNAALGTHCSHLVYPENFCIDYWAKDVESAYRKTEILYYNKNEVREKQLNDEEFLDIELPEPNQLTSADVPKKVVTSNDTQPVADKSTPHVFLAQHTFWDLDDDGYEEPYIIVVHKETKKVVRIIARWDEDGVKKNSKGDIIRIEPVEYFTAFPFIPNPDGSIYACGFGMLLGSLNNAVNTLINLLIDAGVMNNLQSGFIGRSLRIREGQVQLRPNEWKVVNASGEDLQKGIYPLPTKEPSAVLMSLLQMLITSGNQLASIAEIFVGKMPGQNTPATTTQETVQQGMAVFTAVYKRVYRSLSEEFCKIFRLNRITPGILDEEIDLADIQIQDSDYRDTKRLIIPGGDPSGDSNTVKQQKIASVGQLIQLQTINVMEYTKRTLEAFDIPNADGLIAQPQPPQPDPKMQTEQMKQQTLQMKSELDSKSKEQDMQIKQQTAAIDRQAAIDKNEAQRKELEVKVATKAMEAKHRQQSMALDAAAHKQGLTFEAMKHQQEVERGQSQIQREDAQASADMARDEQLHNQKMKLQSQAAQQKPQAGANSKSNRKGKRKR